MTLNQFFAPSSRWNWATKMQIPLKFREFIAKKRRETKRGPDQLLRGSFDIRTVKKYYLWAPVCVEAPLGCIKIYHTNSRKKRKADEHI